MASSRPFLLIVLVLSLTFAFAASAVLPDCPDDVEVVDIGDACGDAYPQRSCGATLGSGPGGSFFSPTPERRIFPGVLAPAEPATIQDVDGEAAMSCVEGRCAASAPGGLGHVCDGGGCDEGLTCKVEKDIGTLLEGSGGNGMRCVRIAPLNMIGECGRMANGPNFLVCEGGVVCIGSKIGASCRG